MRQILYQLPHRRLSDEQRVPSRVYAIIGDATLKDMPGQTVIADKGYDAQARVVQPLLDKGKHVVIPSRSTSKQQREYNRHLYKERHLVENFFVRLKQYRAIATRYDKTARNLSGRHSVGGIDGLAGLSPKTLSATGI